jgi:hypothetical protein
VADGRARLVDAAQRIRRACRAVLRASGAGPTTVPAPDDGGDAPADDEATLS